MRARAVPGPGLRPAPTVPMIHLFVDSNAELLESRAAFLRERLPGFTVTALADARAAQAWIARAEALDVLVTEAIFDAGQTGFSLRDKARARFPHLRVLFTTRFDLSGFEEQVDGTSVLKDGPYPPEKLLLRVQALLSAPVDASEPPPVMVPGTVLGNYQVLDRLYIENETETYRALQVSVQRPVALVLLKPEFLNQPEVVGKFMERIRVKASIEFARIAPLYEAGEANGWLFYTRELPRGRTLEEIEQGNELLNERRVAEVLHGITEAMEHATSRGYHHRSLAARDIYIDGEHHASITNIFRQSAPKKRDPRADVRALLALMRPVAAEGKARGLLTELERANPDWRGLLDSLEDVRDAMREHSIVKRIEAETLPSVVASSGRPWWAWVVFLTVLAVIAAIGAMTNGFGTRLTALTAPKLPADDEWVRIPAGQFTYQEKKREKLPEFWISRHEVTIGQYAEFLTALKKAAPGQFDHPKQPKTKLTHQPPNWEAFLAAAVNGTVFNGEPISIHTPVTNVDWFDAWSYAKWRGLRLPTEMEWEKAARGEKGLRYPWGDQDERGAANLGDDYSAKPNQKGGQIDGHNLAAPIHAPTRDVSPYGVRFMAGNVQEWTSGEQRDAKNPDGEWPEHPELPDLRVPVARGGHFGLKTNDQLLTARHYPDAPTETGIARGFRVVRDTPP